MQVNRKNKYVIEKLNDEYWRKKLNSKCKVREEGRGMKN